MDSQAITQQAGDKERWNVIVKAGDDSISTPEPDASSSGEEKEGISKCPEILYKVQYKDYSGEIKGTKELTAPYKLKKTEYGDCMN